MPRPRPGLVADLELQQLAAYQRDVESALHLYFSRDSPTFIVRFANMTQEEVIAELAQRISETDARSAFVILTSLEASFRIDFDSRCRNRLKDQLSVHFRVVKGERKKSVRLDDILEGWKIHTSASPRLIAQLRGAFKFRHWLAHGRYWTPKFGGIYDFVSVRFMAESVIGGFPFVS